MRRSLSNVNSERASPPSVALLIAAVATTGTLGTIACGRSMPGPDLTAAPFAPIGPTPTSQNATVGLVFEITAQGRQPVAQARVELDMIYGLGDVSATTLTDTDGRYVLCGLSGHDSTYVYASKAGYRLGDVGTVALNGDTVHDIELQR